MNRRRLLAATALTDKDLELPALSPKLPFEEVLEYRRQHGAELAAARLELGRLARRIREEPWTDEFWQTVESDSIPTLESELANCRRARDSWSKTQSATVLKAAGLRPLPAAEARVERLERRAKEIDPDFGSGAQAGASGPPNLRASPPSVSGAVA